MKEETKHALEKAIKACANSAAEACDALKAMQYTQAAVNAANALIGLSNEERQSK